jgi:hypothetical protein
MWTILLIHASSLLSHPLTNFIGVCVESQLQTLIPLVFSLIQLIINLM